MTGLKPVILGSMLLGALLGFSHEEWQMAIESAQVQAGQVSYPPDNSFFMYHLKIWTLMVQIPAFFLKFGITDAFLNHISSALMGAFLYSNQAVITYLLSRSLIFSLGFPAAVWISRMFQVGDTYEIMLYDEPHTFGIVAPAYAVLVFQLQALRKERLSGFLLGLAPAVHPTVGVWTIGISAIHGLMGSSFARTWRKWIPYWVLGCLLTLLSFIIHLRLSASLPEISGEEARRYLEGFTASWDMHRRPVRPTSLAVLLALLLIALVVRFRREGQTHQTPSASPTDFSAAGNPNEQASTLLLELLGLSAAAALICAALSHLQGWLPSPLVAAMPWRNLSISGLAFPFVLGGLLGRERSCTQTQGILLVLLLCFRQPLLWAGAPFRGAWVVAGMAFLIGPTLRIAGEHSAQGRRYFVLLLAVLAAVLSTRPELYRSVFPEIRAVYDSILPALALLASGLVLVIRLPKGVARPLRGLLGLLLGLLGASAGVDAWEAAQLRSARLASQASDALFARAAAEPGVLVTASDLTRIQVRTRRPVLLHGYNLNVLPYVLESGPAMEAALRQVYGLSLFRPPGIRTGGMDSEDGRVTFEERSQAEWVRLAPQFQLTQVLTPKNWALDLPMVAENEQYRLWQIPVD